VANFLVIWKGFQKTQKLAIYKTMTEEIIYSNILTKGDPCALESVTFELTLGFDVPPEEVCQGSGSVTIPITETMPTVYTNPGVEIIELFTIGTYEVRFELSIRLCDTNGLYHIYANVNGSCPTNSQLGIGDSMLSQLPPDQPFYFPGGAGPITLNTAANPP